MQGAGLHPGSFCPSMTRFWHHGTLEFKTDNKLLFDFSLEELPEAHWNLDSFTYDLHQDAQMNQNNIMTEYEKKFSALGNPIYKFIASR